MPSSMTRRDALRLGVATCLSTPTLIHAGEPKSSRRTLGNCILIKMVGGPSQLDSFDPKPDAPAEIRGPFQSIPTTIPGIRFSELFPKLAQRAKHVSVIRSICHNGPAIHEIGFNLLETGHAQAGHPHFRSFLPDDRCVEIGSSRSGENPYRQALQQIEAGARLVTITQYPSVFARNTWDIHGTKPFANFAQMKQTVAPEFDNGVSMLLGDLQQRGLLESTMVVATGEFGRTPRINPLGGRDHHPGVWSCLIAGGLVQGGRVVGESDGHAPTDRPVSPLELLATITLGLGIPSMDNAVQPIPELL